MDSKPTTKPFPGFANLYQLSNPGSDRAFVASLDLPVATALGVLRDEVRDEIALCGRRALGASEPQDVIWTTLAFPVLLSSRVLDIFRRSGFTGWSSSGCEVRTKRSIELQYYFLRVHGRCGPIVGDRSVKVDKIFPGGAFSVLRGLYFDADTWDGSDVFMPAGDVAFIFVTERVKRAFEDNKIGNALFTALDNVDQIPISA